MEPVASAKYCPSSTSLLLSSLPSSLLALLLLLLLVQLPSMATCHEEMKSIDVGQRVLPVRLGRPAFGPESLAFDHRGDGPYTGVSNGRILRWRGTRRGWTEFAHNYKHETVAMCAAKKRLALTESACGRPLGLQFHRASGDLYYADAYLGLMRVGRRGGIAQVVATEAGGAPLNFVNGVDVDQETGHVYFTDSSATYQRRNQEETMITLTDDGGDFSEGRGQTPNGLACPPFRLIVISDRISCASGCSADNSYSAAQQKACSYTTAAQLQYNGTRLFCCRPAATRCGSEQRKRWPV